MPSSTRMDQVYNAMNVCIGYGVIIILKGKLTSPHLVLSVYQNAFEGLVSFQ